MAVQVALEVEVRQGLALADGQQRLQGRIRLDIVLVLQVLLLHVVVDALRHLAAAHESAIGLAKELAQLIRHLGGALKDAEHTGLGIRALGNGCAPLALACILQLTVHALLELLHLAQHRRHSLAQGVQVASHGLQVLIQSGGGAGSRGDCSLHHRGRGHHHRGGSCSGGCSLRGLDSLLGRLHSGGSHDRGGDHGGSGLLSDSLGGGLGGGGRSVHYTGD